MIRRFVPVYLITGFIESGKTTLGLTVLGNERFTNGGRVLILCCEEGETEWDDDSLDKYKGVLVNLDNPSRFLISSRNIGDMTHSGLFSKTSLSLFLTAATPWA